MGHKKHNQQYTFKDFLPLILLLSLIASIVIMHQYYYGPNRYEAMRVSMAAFFLIFGFFKIINLKGFAQAYSMYDIIAKKYLWYGYLYPFIEIGLGIAYTFTWYLTWTNKITLLVMLISALGVFNKLQQKEDIVCACLGAVFKIPMTYVTFLEDLLMASMALFMLL